MVLVVCRQGLTYQSSPRLAIEHVTIYSRYCGYRWRLRDRIFSLLGVDRHCKTTGIGKVSRCRKAVASSNWREKGQKQGFCAKRSDIKGLIARSEHVPSSMLAEARMDARGHQGWPTPFSCSITPQLLYSPARLLDDCPSSGFSSSCKASYRLKQPSQAQRSLASPSVPPSRGSAGPRSSADGTRCLRNAQHRREQAKI